jgi:hypothetical protein
MLRTIGLSSVVLLAASLAGFAQEPSAAKPGPEHAEMKKLEGVWDAAMKMPDSPEVMPGVVTYKMDLEGLWLTSDFRMDVPGFKFQGRGTDGYDQRKKKYVAIWIDSMSTTPLIMEGTQDPATKTITMTGESIGQDSKPEKVKTVTKFVDDDHFTFEMFMVGADGKETTAFTINYTRKKK